MGGAWDAGLGGVGLTWADSPESRFGEILCDIYVQTIAKGRGGSSTKTSQTTDGPTDIGHRKKFQLQTPTQIQPCSLPSQLDPPPA